MFAALAKIILKSRIEKENNSRKKRFLSWDAIQKMALLIEHDPKLNKSQIDRFVQESGKYVEVFYIETTSELSSFGDWHCFTRKETGFLKLPKQNSLVELKGKKFDLLINTCNSHNLFAIALSSSIEATLKLGTASKFSESDMIISKNEGLGLLAYLKVVDSYLKMIKV